MRTRLENTLRLIRRFNDALNRRDADAMMADMTDDCVFENTDPPPDGARYEGQSAVRAFWEDFFRGSAQAHIDMEDIFVADDRCVMLWVYRWIDTGGKSGRVRGVDVYRVREGKIAEKLSYVKG